MNIKFSTYWNTSGSLSMVHLFGDWFESFLKICLALVWYSPTFLPDCSSTKFNFRVNWDIFHVPRHLVWMQRAVGRRWLLLSASIAPCLCSTVQLSFVPKHSWCALYRNFLRATSLLTLQNLPISGWGLRERSRIVRDVCICSSCMHSQCHGQNDPK